MADAVSWTAYAVRQVHYRPEGTLDVAAKLVHL